MQKKLSGTILNLLHDEITHSEIIDLIPQVASVMAKLEAIHFPESGRLVASSAMPVRSSASLAYDVDIGPCMAGRTPGGQHAFLKDMLCFLFDAWISEDTNEGREWDVDD